MTSQTKALAAQHFIDLDDVQVFVRTPIGSLPDGNQHSGAGLITSVTGHFSCDLAAISNSCSAVGLSHPSPIAALA